MKKPKIKKVYVGIIGEKGSGKDTVTKFLRRLLPGKRVRHVTFSDVLSETLDLWYLPKTRGNYQKLTPMMVDTYGPSTLANIVKNRAMARKADVVCLPGMRWFADLQMLRALNRQKDSKSFIVYVTAPAKMRYLRTKQRGKKADEKKATFAKFMRQEKARTEINIPKIGRGADVVIKNTGTKQDFYNAVKEKIVPRIKGPR